MDAMGCSEVLFLTLYRSLRGVEFYSLSGCAKDDPQIGKIQPVSASKVAACNHNKTPELSKMFIKDTHPPALPPLL